MRSDELEVNPPLDPERELPPDPAVEGAGLGEAQRLSEETRRLIEERDALNDRLLRALAEADNYRKRVQRELAEARLHATTEAVRPFLAVLDGFERAAQHAATRAHAGGGAEAREMRQGMELLHRQFLDAARKVGLEPVEAVGQRFDPHLHEAIEMVDSDHVPEGAVAEELQRGYKLKDRLIRPAMVKVARAKS